MSLQMKGSLNTCLALRKSQARAQVTSKAGTIVVSAVREKKCSCRNSAGDSIDGTLID